MTRDKNTYRQMVQAARPDITDAEFDVIWAEFLTAAAAPGYDPMALIQTALNVGFDADAALTRIEAEAQEGQ